MTDDLARRIGRLNEFKKKLNNLSIFGVDDKARQWLNQNKHWVEHEITQAGCARILKISEPGGPVMDINPLDLPLREPYFKERVLPALLDMIDQTIGVLQDPLPEIQRPPSGKIKVEAPSEDKKVQVQRGLAFVVMAMDEDNPELVDVLNTIKDAARGFEITAVRIDDDLRRSRITDRMLESIQKAEFVIVDLTHERPNVFYEAGYALGIGKTPIYIARHGTNIHFNVQDYPVEFFKSMTELKAKLVLAFASAMAFGNR